MFCPGRLWFECTLARLHWANKSGPRRHGGQRYWCWIPREGEGREDRCEMGDFIGGSSWRQRGHVVFNIQVPTRTYEFPQHVIFILHLVSNKTDVSQFPNVFLPVKKSGHCGIVVPIMTRYAAQQFLPKWYWNPAPVGSRVVHSLSDGSYETQSPSAIDSGNNVHKPEDLDQWTRACVVQVINTDDVIVIKEKVITDEGISWFEQLLMYILDQDLVHIFSNRLSYLSSFSREICTVDRILLSTLR
jgi:hypothetical protein